MALSPSAYAKKMGVCRETVYRAVRRGELKVKRIGSRLVIVEALFSSDELVGQLLQSLERIEARQVKFEQFFLSSIPIATAEDAKAWLHTLKKGNGTNGRY